MENGATRLNLARFYVLDVPAEAIENALAEFVAVTNRALFDFEGNAAEFHFFSADKDFCLEHVSALRQLLSGAELRAAIFVNIGQDRRIVGVSGLFQHSAAAFERLPVPRFFTFKENAKPGFRNSGREEFRPEKTPSARTARTRPKI
jgi:hypothetical protein